MKEAGIKFNCNWIEGKPVDYNLICNLNAWRDLLHSYGLIGVDDENRLPGGHGIGHGNVSVRHHENKFIITGAGTGKLNTLSSWQYTIVTGYNISENSLTCEGPVQASSESLTHAMIYECDENVNAVIHVHHHELWEKLIYNIPTTGTDIAYGTPEMALEMQRLFRDAQLGEKKILAMAGHEDGLISFGNSIHEAGEIILSKLDLLNESVQTKKVL